MLLTLLGIRQMVKFLSDKSDIDVMFCLQSYRELIMDRSLVY